MDEQVKLIWIKLVTDSIANRYRFIGKTRYITYLTDHNVESLSLSALGISPLYCSLFGLFRERDRLWFSPNHIFQLDELASEDVFFRIR